MKNVKKIDVHTHVTLHKDIAPKLQVTGQSFLSPQEQIDIHRQLNVEKAVLLPLVSPEGQWALITNEDCSISFSEFSYAFTENHLKVYHNETLIYPIN